MVCWLGVMLMFFRDSRVSRRTLICGALLFVFVETMFQLFEVNLITSALIADKLAVNYPGFLLRSYQYGSLNSTGGGLIGAILAWPMYKALDVWGAVIVLVCACAMALMVMTGASFGELGMMLSEWLDDWRVRIREEREERMAQQQEREEQALEEARIANEQRQKKRAQKEQQEKQLREKERKEQAQREKEAAQMQAEQDAAPQQEMPVSPKKGRSRAKLTVLEGGEAEERVFPQPLFESSAPVVPAPRRNGRKTEATLFIERSEAFERVDLDQRQDVTERRRRYSGTKEDVGSAFVYNGSGAGREGAQESVYAAYGQKQTDYSSYQPVTDRTYARMDSDVPAQDEAAAQENGYTVGDVLSDVPAYEEPVYEAPVYEQPVYDAPVYAEPAYEEPAYEEPVYAMEADEPADQEPAYDEPAYDAPVYDVPEYSEPAYTEPVYEEPVYTAPMRREAAGPVRMQQAQMPEHRFDVEMDEGYTPPSSIPARHEWSRGERADKDSPAAAPSPDWAPMRSIRPEELRPAGTPMKDRQQDQTIVQLRGNRLDGTPIQMPRKDTHEGPQGMKEPYMYPPIDLLDKGKSAQDPHLNAKIEAGSRQLLATLESFGVQAKLTHVTHGPAITRYELQPAPGVKVSRIVNLVDDIALNMASDGVRIEAPIPGKPAVGIEIPNEKIDMVSLRDILESQEMMRQKAPTVVALGKGISGAPVVADMAKMPHVLIAGATGSGKSVCINTIISSIIFRASPDEVRLILIDPKVVELSVYNGIPHLLVPVVTDPKKASAALSWAVVEMEHRYKRFETMGVRNIESYNNAIGPGEERMSKIIVIIDELADLMMVAPGEVEESICRLAQLARAAGIHLVIATQRPSVNVITGVIKANIPSRIAFAVSSQIDSRTILDAGGAEKLLGKGDMLYAPQGSGKPTRVQGCFVSEEEVQRIVDYVRGKHTAEYNEDVIEQMNSATEEEKAPAGDAPAGGEPVDEMLSKAIELAIDAGQVSISMLQRRLRVGYARAGRLVDEMTLRGIAGEAEGPTKPRTVLITREEWRRMQENEE